MKIKQKIKGYFTDKPKKDFWFWAFVTLLFFRYVSYPIIYFLTFFLIGLVTPEVDVTTMQMTFTTASNNIANILISPMEKLYIAGQTIGSNHPLIAKILFFALSNFVYVIWVAMIILILNLFRYGTYWIVREFLAKKKSVKTK